MPSSRGSSQSRTQTRISCIAGEVSTAEPSGKHSDFSLLILTAIIRQNEVLKVSRLVPMRKPGINPQDHWVLLTEKTGPFREHPCRLSDSSLSVSLRCFTVL